jgi:hypothetical protein
VNNRRLILAAVVAAISAGCSGGAGASSSPPASAAPSAAAPSAAAPSPAAAIPDAIVGSWTTTITEADLRAGGVTADGELSENSGVFTMTLGADGTWSTSQETDVPIRWPVFKGTFVATGPDSFRQTTTFPADFAGDVVDFTWSAEGGSLAVKVPQPPDHILGIIMESHPWQPKQ